MLTPNASQFLRFATALLLAASLLAASPLVTSPLAAQNAAAATATPVVHTSAGPRDLSRPASRVVGEWIDQRGTVWYIGAHNDDEEGVLYVVRSNSVRSRWRYRIVEESEDDHLVLFITEPNQATRELALIVARDGQRVTSARRSMSGVTFAETDTLRYRGPKHRP